MSKHIKKIDLKNSKKTSRTLPMIAVLAALGVSSLTYTVTVSADSVTTTKTTGIHIQKGKRGHDEKHERAMLHASSTPREKPAAAGVITSILGSVVTVQDRDGALYTIDVAGATILKGGRGQASTTIAITDLKVGDMLGAKGVKTGTHVIAKQVMTSPQHPFMKRLHDMQKTR